LLPALALAALVAGLVQAPEGFRGGLGT